MKKLLYSSVVLLITIVLCKFIVLENTINLTGIHNETINVSDIINNTITIEEFERSFQEVAWAFLYAWGKCSI